MDRSAPFCGGEALLLCHEAGAQQLRDPCLNIGSLRCLNILLTALHLGGRELGGGSGSGRMGVFPGKGAHQLLRGRQRRIDGGSLLLIRMKNLPLHALHMIICNAPGVFGNSELAVRSAALCKQHSGLHAVQSCQQHPFPGLIHLGSEPSLGRHTCSGAKSGQDACGIPVCIRHDQPVLCSGHGNIQQPDFL